jgi:group I intron endonuclease
MHVYTITHIDSCRTYVGKAHDPARRLIEHRCPGNARKYPTSALYKAAAKYGWSAFDFAVVQSCESDEASYIAESEWIAALKSDDKRFGFNMNGGGEGGARPTEEVRKRISNAGRGLKRSEETRARMRAAQARRKPASAETRAKIGAATRARLTPEAHAKMTEAARQANIGKPLSEATKAKLRGRSHELSHEARSRMFSAEANAKRGAATKRIWESLSVEARERRLAGFRSSKDARKKT